MNGHSNDFLEEVVAQCAFWRDGAGAALVRVKGPNYSPIWRIDSTIFRRWIKGQAHKRRHSIDDDELETFVRTLLSRAIAGKISAGA